MHIEQINDILTKLDALDLSGIDTVEKELEFIFSFFPNSSYRVFSIAEQGVIDGRYYDSCVYGYVLGPSNIYKSRIVERIRQKMNPPEYPFQKTLLENYVDDIRNGHTHKNNGRVETLYLQALAYMQQHEGEPGAENYDPKRKWW